MRRTLLLLALLTATACLEAQWQLQDSRTSADLRGIDNVGQGVAWASGADGAILRTEDNGQHWQLCAEPPGGEHLDFRAIQAFDNNTAIVMSSGKGDLSRLYKTTDRCQTWKLLFTNPDKDGFWDALSFQNRQFGWLLGDPVNNTFASFITNDGGAHWTRVRNHGLEASPSSQGVFAASNSSMYVRIGFMALGTGGTAGAMIYRETYVPCLDNCPATELNTDNKRVPVEIGSHTESSGIFSVDARSKTDHSPIGDSIFVAVGGDYLKPNDSTRTAAFTTDGGKTWQTATTPPHGFRSAVAYDAKSNTWITVGPNGTDISTDDGRNWRALKPNPALNEPPDTDQHWNALSLPFAVGPHGRIGLLRPQALAPKPTASANHP